MGALSGATTGNWPSSTSFATAADETGDPTLPVSPAGIDRGKSVGGDENREWTVTSSGLEAVSRSVGSDECDFSLLAAVCRTSGVGRRPVERLNPEGIRFQRDFCTEGVGGTSGSEYPGAGRIPGGIESGDGDS
jgi:hypothetical protein